MQFDFRAEEVTASSSTNVYELDVYVDAEADVVFEAIKDDVDHDLIMRCLTKEEVIDYFEIEEAENGTD